MRALNDAEVATFRSDGVVHLPGAVNEALVAEIFESVDQLIESPGRFGGSMTPRTATGMFFQDRYLHPTHSDFLRYANDCGLAIAAATATGSKRIISITTMSSSKSLEPKKVSCGTKTAHIGQLTDLKFARAG